MSDCPNCAAKDEALRYVRSGLELEEVQDLEDAPGESLRIVDAALSSTAGSELLARLEKAEAGHCATLVSDHETMKSMQARLESMRAAIEQTLKDAGKWNIGGPWVDEMRSRFRALSSTAGSELLARLEMLEKAVENRGRVLDLETARLEKAEAERESMRRLAADLNAKLDDTHTHRCFRCDATVTGKTAGMQAQLEAMRAALERIASRAVSRPVHACEVDTFDLALIADDASAALLPSAPRMSDEGAKVYAENRKRLPRPLCDRNAVLEEACAVLDYRIDIEKVRALKDTEEGT